MSPDKMNTSSGGGGSSSLISFNLDTSFVNSRSDSSGSCSREDICSSLFRVRERERERVGVRVASRKRLCFFELDVYSMESC